MIVDLHSHTTCSDGSLSPSALIHLAAESGVSQLAITDHDTVAAWHQDDLPSLAEPFDLALIPAIEFSTTWNKINVHVVGLNIDINSDAITTACHYQSEARKQRAVLIAEALDKVGIKGSLEGATHLSNGNVGRPHFAQFLVDIGVVTNVNQAFKKYLGSGKPGDVKKLWASLPQIIEWIRSAGGTAVLAHPLKYKLTRRKLLLLLDDFMAAGGESMEVVSGKQLPNDTRDLAQICEQKLLLASCGSDFHHPNQSWASLGNFPTIPQNCKAVWENWA